LHEWRGLPALSHAAEVIDNREEGRFELRVDGHLAQLVYRLRGSRLELVHTEVPEELEGQGLGGQLVQAAVRKAQEEGLEIVPFCPFAREWLQRHPDETEGVTITAAR
jgi:predicted GNAT family acetyltransferase